MDGYKITRVRGREVLDSRGNPTVEAEVFTRTARGSAIVPSGASTGIYEKLELRDRTRRYLGKGVRKAVKNISLIEKKLKGVDVRRQKDIDELMISLDGTEKRSRIGANAILSVSLAASRTAADARGVPLYRHIAGLVKNKKIILPVPFCNVINGGKHAANPLEMQEFMIAPIKTKSFAEGVRAVSETYHVLREIIAKKYGKNAINVGDEGGFAPPIEKAEQALMLIEKAREKAGYLKEVRPAMDPAASEFWNKGGYYRLDRRYSGRALSEYYSSLIRKFGVVSLEDPFEQNDLESFAGFRKKAKIQIVGDDLLVTNVKRIRLALENGLCNALLLKPNQVGTLTESLEAYGLAKKSGWNTMVSHRSGDTEDPYIADLAAGIGCGQAKIGAPCRGERTAKYNQLLRIEEELGSTASYARW